MGIFRRARMSVFMIIAGKKVIKNVHFCAVDTLSWQIEWEYQADWQEKLADLAQWVFISYRRGEKIVKKVGFIRKNGIFDKISGFFAIYRKERIL